MMPGALVIGQTGGPTAVINASLAGIIAEARQYSAFGRILGMRHGFEGLLADRLVDLSDLPQDVLERLAQTPAAALGSSRRKITEQDYEQALMACRRLDVRGLILIGGNGTMYIGDQLADYAVAAGYELSVMGVPKTIDNDLAVTDHTPGYGSAARFLALAVRDTGRDLEAMATFDDVLILEALGRHAGWLAAASALGKEHADDAPHLVYVPEIVFDEARFLDDVRRIHSRLGRVFVVIGEGIRTADGEFVGGKNAPRDAMGRVLYSAAPGAAAYLTDCVRQRLGLQVRFLRPSLIGRGFSACVSSVDRTEAWLAGQAAVRQLASGTSGLMITLERQADYPYTCVPGAAPLDMVAGLEKPLPREFMDDGGTMIAPAFYDYALPLIGDPLPLHVRL
jgi:6-phosphofructokinase